jgi:hypothetical protein
VRYLPPIPWSDVPSGAVVIDSNGTPRTVLANAAAGTEQAIYVEGLSPIALPREWPAYPVELDETDAIGNLYAAGLNPTPIEGN